MKAPSWITSLGALVALGTSAANFVRAGGAQEEANRNTAREVTRVERDLDRARTGLQREIDLACACCRHR